MTTNTKYIFVTGGVVSGLGKGITAASLGRLLKARGYSVTMQKFDPYINIDPGTMNPIQHGEVFVTDDGAETDLDLGHYERFIDESLGKNSNVTSGKVYWSVLSKERRGDFGGGTVQVIPHITNEIKSRFYRAKSPDENRIAIIEVGGTVGDIESQPFLESIRQFQHDVGHENAILIHVTLIPYLKASGEMKTKPTQASVKELQAMGNTEQEKAEAMKRYIREVFIPEYAKNFNKGLSETDIKFYGKIHFDRSRSDNQLNMHCHLIVSRKDQSNKKKLSPLTNHKNTKKGTVTGGFDRVNLFQQAEQGFDKLFGYDRQLSESFEYSNTMKNGSIDDKLKMQEQELQEPKQYFTDEKKKEVLQSSEKENVISCNLDSKQENKHAYNQPNNNGCDSLLSIFSLGDGNNYDATLAEELQTQKRKKKKGIRR